MYLRNNMNPARKPYSIELNCSKCGSVGFLTSPNQTFPTLILSGLLFLIPRGIMIFYDFRKIMYVNIQSEYRTSKQESLCDIEKNTRCNVMHSASLKKCECDTRQDEEYRTSILNYGLVRVHHDFLAVIPFVLVN